MLGIAQVVGVSLVILGSQGIFLTPGFPGDFPRDRTQVSHITGRFFTTWATEKPIDGAKEENITRKEPEEYYY